MLGGFCWQLSVAIIQKPAGKRRYYSGAIVAFGKWVSRRVGLAKRMQEFEERNGKTQSRFVG